MYSVCSHDIKISAETAFQGHGATTSDCFSVWSYDIQIENMGKSPIMILRRYWKLIDEMGLMREITGDGVVGQKPVIHPGEVFQYTSYANIRAGSGMMYGKYYALDLDSGEEIELDIPAISLDSPKEKVIVN